MSRNVSLSSITLSMRLKEVRHILGRGKLSLRSLDPTADERAYYQWRIGNAFLDGVFDRDSAVVMIAYSSGSRSRPFSNIILNFDTISSIERKIGPPYRKVSPQYGEGEYVFYSVVYACGPNRSEEVTFSTGLRCQRPDMDACLAEGPLEERPITKVALSRAMR